MAFLDFLKNRRSAQLVLGGLDRRREDLLLADAPAAEIVKLDAEGDHARIKLEKLDLFESEIHARLSEVEGIEAEVEWRRLFDARHAAACDFATSFNETCGAMFALRSATNAASASEIGRKFGLLSEPPPLILSGESLQQMPAKRVDQLRALRHQHFARLVMHERRLVLQRAHAGKAHRRPCHRFADPGGVGRVILLPAHSTDSSRAANIKNLCMIKFSYLSTTPSLYRPAGPVSRKSQLLPVGPAKADNV